MHVHNPREACRLGMGFRSDNKQKDNYTDQSAPCIEPRKAMPCAFWGFGGVVDQLSIL
jgi:hypothetical protein